MSPCHPGPLPPTAGSVSSRPRGAIAVSAQSAVTPGSGATSTRHASESERRTSQASQASQASQTKKRRGLAM